MHTIRIKLDLQNKTIKEKIAEFKEIAKKMKLDANPDVRTAGAVLENEIDDLKDRDADNTVAKQAAKAATQALNSQDHTTDDSINSAAAEVMKAYPNNVDKFTQLGYESEDTEPTAPARPEQVTGLSATQGDASGEVDLVWNRAEPRIIGYKIEINDVDHDVEEEWQNADPEFVTKSKATIEELEKGKRYWFRVTARNTTGDGAPSEEVDIIVN